MDFVLLLVFGIHKELVVLEFEVFHVATSRLVVPIEG